MKSQKHYKVIIRIVRMCTDMASCVSISLYCVSYIYVHIILQEPDFTENELIYDDLNIDDSTPGKINTTALTLTLCQGKMLKHICQHKRKFCLTFIKSVEII